MLNYKRLVEYGFMLGAIFFLAHEAFAYENVKTHPLITEKGKDIVQAGTAVRYFELDAKLNWMAAGSTNEDIPLSRVRSHFYNAATGDPLRVSDGGILLPPFPLSDTAIVHGRGQWDYAVNAYLVGQVDVAYERLGHALHLLTQDMAQPGHVHNDPHLIFGSLNADKATLEQRAEEIAANQPAAFPNGTVAVAPASSVFPPLTEVTAEDFGVDLARLTYSLSRFTGQRDNTTGLGTINIGSNQRSIGFIAGDPFGIGCSNRSHWQLAGKTRPLCWDPSQIYDGPLFDNDWWVEPERLGISDPHLTDTMFYIDRYEEVDIGIGSARVGLNDHFIATLIPHAINYTAGLIKLFAKTVDPNPPTISLHTKDGDVVLSGGAARDIVVDASDIPPQYDPKWGASGIYRLIFTQTSGGTFSSTVPFSGAYRVSYTPSQLPEGDYVVQAIDGLANVSVPIVFTIARTPPKLLLINADGERMDHGSVSENAVVTSFATHNPARVRSLEFFNGNFFAFEVPTPPGKQDLNVRVEFPPKSWHYVRACDVALNCVYTLFGVFSPEETPPAPPGPPKARPGSTQRPNPKPGEPFPPPDDPDNPPPPPPPGPPGPVTPPPCRGERCLTEPPAPAPSWVMKPRKPKYCDSPRNCLIPVAFPHDPNAKYGPAGSVNPGQVMTYTIEFENEGEGLALETFVRDTLDPALDDAALVLRDMRRVNYLTETETPANFPWSYDARTRTITVMTGDADFRQGGRFILEARLKADVAPGTIIANQAVVHFPNSLEVTPTNVIVSAVPLPTLLAYEGPSSTTYLDQTWFTARLTAAGKPLALQPVEFHLAGSSWTVMTDASGLASISTAIAVLPGAYNLHARFPGDGLLYSPRETPIDFVVAKKSVRLDAPFAAVRSTETVRLVINLTDDDNRPLTAQLEDPKIIHLELLLNGEVTSLGSVLLSGASVAFDVSLPRPLQLSWSVRARFDGDLRYAPAISTGALRLIDQTPPTITIVSPAGGTYSGSQLIQVGFSAQDGDDPAPVATAMLVSSGTGQSLPVSHGDAVAASSLSTGQWSLLVQATDWADNQAMAQGAVFEVAVVPDTLAPHTSLSLGQPQTGSAPVYIASSTAIGFTAIDDLTTSGDGIGSGVARTEYVVDGGTSALFSGNFTVAAEGAHNITFFSADFAGNVEGAQTRELIVDVTAPLTRLLIGGVSVSTAGVSLATTDEISLAAEDAGAGIAATYYEVNGASASVFGSTFTLAVGAHAFAFQSVDNLGNVEAIQNVLLTVRPPDFGESLLVLDYPSSMGVGVEQAVGGVVQIRGRVLDAREVSWTLEAASGVAASSGFAQIAAGAGNISGVLASWNTASLSGYQTLRLRAADAFGNASSTEAVVFVGSPAFNFAIGRKDSHVIVNTIKGPTGIAVRSDGAIWAASTENDTILLLSPAGVLLGTAGHAPGHSGEDKEHGKKDKDHDDEDADGLRFKTPQGLALDADDNLYVADRDLNRVVKLSPDGQVLLLQLGKRDGQGRPKPGSGPGELRHPFDVAVDTNGDVYVADSGNRRIQAFNASGAFLREFGSGVLLSTSEVRGIALTTEGLWVSDKEQERIFLFSRAGGLIKSIGDSDSVVGEISRMRGLASDRLGALYVVEPNRDRTQKFDPQGKGLLAFGSKAGLSHADKLAKRYLTQPIDAALAPDGSIWITDTGRDRIVRYALPVTGGYGVAAYSTGGGAGSSVEPARRIVDHKDGDKVERDDGAGVHVPKGALAADLEITVDKGDENQDKERKTAKRRELKITAVSEEVQYGPEGTNFNTPVTLTLPYDAAAIAAQSLKEDDLKVYYWNPTLQDWEAMPSVVDKLTKTVNAQTSHFSAYQVGALGGIGVAAIDDFGLRDGYVFPNPSRNGSAVTFRMQPGSADSVEVRVYDLAGRKVHSSTDFRFRGPLDDGNGKGPQNTYDHVWDVSGIGSGVYHYVMTAKKAGQPDIRKTGKIGIVK